MGAVIIEGTGLVVQKGKRCILDVPTFSLREGERMGIIGPNGAGKSTLLQVMALLLSPHSGDVRFMGAKLSSRKSRQEARRSMAVVFQDPLLLSTTVFENVAVGLKIRGFRGIEVRQRVWDWLERLRIDHLAERFPYNLSGGEAQRVNLARVFVLEPKIIFMDEPLVFLDANSRLEIMEDLLRIFAHTPAALLWATHDFGELPVLTSNTAVMQNGNLVQQGATREVLNGPRTVSVARFLGFENVWQGSVINGAENEIMRVRIDQGVEFAVPIRSGVSAGSPVSICVRAQNIRLVNEGYSQKNILPARVVGCVPRGLGFLVTVHYEEIEIKAASPKEFSIGTQVLVELPPENLHVLPSSRI